MPKTTVTINASPNPTGLTMAERKLAMEVLKSLEDSVTRERKRLEARSYRYSWDADDERRLRQRIYRSAYNQLTGRQKTDVGPFRLDVHPDVADDDMSYVLQSLGVK